MKSHKHSLAKFFCPWTQQPVSPGPPSWVSHSLQNSSPLPLNNGAPRFLNITLFSTLPLYLTHCQVWLNCYVRAPKSTCLEPNPKFLQSVRHHSPDAGGPPHTQWSATFISSFTFSHETLLLPSTLAGGVNAAHSRSSLNCLQQSLTLTSSIQACFRLKELRRERALLCPLLLVLMALDSPPIWLFQQPPDTSAHLQMLTSLPHQLPIHHWSDCTKIDFIRSFPSSISPRKGSKLS